MKKSMNFLIVGAGTVGTATGLGLIHLGHNVTFFDTNPDKINKLRVGGYRTILSLNENPDFEIALICVQTDLNQSENFDLLPLREAIFNLAKYALDNNTKITIAIKSTVLPGTTQMIQNEIFESLPKSQNFIELAYLPEFLRERSAESDFLSGPIRIVASPSRPIRVLFKEILQPTCREFIEFERFEEAELMKISHNLANIVEISFWNQMKVIADRFSVDTLVIKDAVQNSAESRYNLDYAYASGLPIAGHCLPKDLKAVRAFMKEENMRRGVVEGLHEFNFE
jgi:UDPglucose 6-dehydrogenase